MESCTNYLEARVDSLQRGDGLEMGVLTSSSEFDR